MDWIMSDFPALHCLPEFAQTHVHWVCDAIQPPHPLLPLLLLPSFFFSIRVWETKGWLFASDGWSIEASTLASVLLTNIYNWFPLRLTGLISLLSKGLSRVFSSTTIQFSSVSHSVCLTFCDCMGCSIQGFPIHHQPPELAQTPLNWWCHPIIASSVVPFSSCLQSFPASRSFLRSQFFTSGGQSIGVSASASVLPVNILFNL